jgi:hypothetical protein
MTSGSANGHGRDRANGHRAEISEQQLPEQVAELAGKLSEAETKSGRRRFARQIPQLASRSGEATRRGLQSGRDAAARGFRSGREATARAVQSGRDVAVRRAQNGGEAARKGVSGGSDAARRSIQTGTSATWRGLRVSGQWLGAQAMEMAPKVPVRNIATLRAQHPGRETEELADILIRSASRASAGVGAAVGVAAATPFIPTMPVELGVETLALVGIELKLTAELHEVYGMPAPGSATERMLAYLGAWANRRGIRITSNGVALAVGSPLRRKLERRLIAKAGQSTLSLAPLLAGAAAGALIDHHETRRLGTQVRDDLRKRSSQGAAITE